MSEFHASILEACYAEETVMRREHGCVQCVAMVVFGVLPWLCSACCHGCVQCVAMAVFSVLPWLHSVCCHGCVQRVATFRCCMQVIASERGIWVADSLEFLQAANNPSADVGLAAMENRLRCGANEECVVHLAERRCVCVCV